MPKPRHTETKLARLRALRKEPASPGHLAELRQALADPSNLVAAEAAEIVGVRGLAELAGELVAAFGRFMIRKRPTSAAGPRPPSPWRSTRSNTIAKTSS
jgi:hypothetical protein